MTMDQDFDTAILRRAPARTSHSHVVNQLGAAIVRGHYPEGTILPGDAELIAGLGVSRTVLREAMKTLAAKGMVQAKARIGTRILPRSHWNMFDADVLSWHLEHGVDEGFLTALSEMRLALEPAMAAHAATRRTDEEVARLYEVADRMAEPTLTAAAFAQADLRLHLLVAVASANPFMRSISSLTEAALALSFRLSSPAADPDRQRDAALRHRRIVDAIRDRDPEAARDAMTVVIDEGAFRARAALAAGTGTT